MKAIVTLTVTLEINPSEAYKSLGGGGDNVINEVSDLEDYLNKFEHICEVPEIDDVTTEP